jgi:hypothetical protein
MGGNLFQFADRSDSGRYGGRHSQLPSVTGQKPPLLTLIVDLENSRCLAMAALHVRSVVRFY